VASKEQIIAALRLINTYKIGAKKFYQLVENYGSVIAAVDFVSAKGKYKPWSNEQAEIELRKVEAIDAKIILYSDDEYPAILRNYNNAPPLLYVKGNITALNFDSSIAIVGGRAASINGRKTAAKIAKELTEEGVCIVSGMARGIDASAHKGAMFAKNETGSTIAVLGTGIDIVYPPENKDIYEQIQQNGCIISEFPIGTKAVASQFPQRNRVVAALSEAILVIEAGINSGSLITAQFGSEMGKTIFAVPGTPGESRSQGANYLIKKGAVLVEMSADILPFLKGNKKGEKVQKKQAIQKVLVFENNDVNYSEQENEQNIKDDSLISFLTVDGVSVDELIRLTGKDTSTIAMEILELELSGIVERRSGNKVALINQD